MRNIVLSCAALAVLAGFGACKKSNPAPANTASVMFVHACAAGATTINLDARADGKTVAGAANMPFLKGSGYVPVLSGSSVALSFFVTGLNQLTAGTVSMTTGGHYTAFAGGSITAPSFVFVSDNLAAPATGNAKVRFVNLSPDGLNMSCYIGTTKIDSNVAYMECTPFYEVAATTAKIGMVDQVVLTNSGQINSQVLTAGKLYTFMLTGTATGSGSSILTLTAINN